MSHGAFLLEPLGSELVELIQELPRHLRSNTERVEQRLCPDPTDDDHANQEWRRLVVPELKALIASARELVEEDLKDRLAKVRPVGGEPAWRLAIPAKHLKAWISALNTARLTLAAPYDLTQEEVDRPIREIRSQRELDLWKIHVYGELQGLLIDRAG